MSNTKTAMDHFNKVWNEIGSNAFVPFNPKWANGTGYMDGLLEDPEVKDLPTFLVCKSQEPAPQMRKIIFINCGEKGVVAVFQRYTYGGSGVLVSNESTSWLESHEYLRQGVVSALNLETLEAIIGG